MSDVKPIEKISIEHTLEERKINEIIDALATLQSANDKLMVENARLMKENERLTHAVSIGSGGK